MPQLALFGDGMGKRLGECWSVPGKLDNGSSNRDRLSAIRWVWRSTGPASWAAAVLSAALVSFAAWAASTQPGHLAHLGALSRVPRLQRSIGQAPGPGDALSSRTIHRPSHIGFTGWRDDDEEEEGSARPEACTRNSKNAQRNALAEPTDWARRKRQPQAQL